MQNLGLKRIKPCKTYVKPRVIAIRCCQIAEPEAFNSWPTSPGLHPGLRDLTVDLDACHFASSSGFRGVFGLKMVV